MPSRLPPASTPLGSLQDLVVVLQLLGVLFQFGELSTQLLCLLCALFLLAALLRQHEDDLQWWAGAADLWWDPSPCLPPSWRYSCRRASTTPLDNS